MCEEGFEYRECGDPCPQTCRTLGSEDGELCGVLPCMEGCYCPDGTISHSKKAHFTRRRTPAVHRILTSGRKVFCIHIHASLNKARNKSSGVLCFKFSVSLGTDEVHLNHVANTKVLQNLFHLMTLTCFVVQESRNDINVFCRWQVYSLNWVPMLWWRRWCRIPPWINHYKGMPNMVCYANTKRSAKLCRHV